MNTTQTPISTTALLSNPAPRRRWRYVLTGLVVFAATVALFYVEENWRGRRAWENCKRELEAKGAKLDWAYYIPPPVPDDQNIFGVPQMQEGFEGRGRRHFPGPLNFPGYHAGTNSGLMNYPGYQADTNPVRIVVANVMIGLPGATPPSGWAVLQWSDSTNAQAEAARLMQQALGPMAADPAGFIFMVKKPEEVQPARIFLQCQSAPTLKELAQFLPKSFDPRPSWLLSSFEDLQVESTSANSYRETMLAPLSAANFVAWGATIEPDLSIIRQAVQRPYARMAGDYSFPPDIPIPNFVSVRTVSQRLAALAECYMVLGEPEKALDELTLIHQLCRVLEARPTGRPMTLVAAMINVAVAGLYADAIQDGMRMQVWREPQLTALQEQLKDINLRPYVVDAVGFEQVAICHTAEMTPMAGLVNLFDLEEPAQKQKLSFSTWIRGYIARISLIELMPRGWVYQNMVVCANLHQIINDSLASAGPLVEPRQFDAINPTIERELAHPSPFKMLASIAIPNFSKAFQTMTLNQTKANQAQIACALERYRLAHGEYPPGLETLTPQFIDKIPPDLIGGQPPHYRRTHDGKFLLYSIGWSEHDHGGQTGKDGDWVWGED
jgi:hypothetical protein